MRRFFLLSSLAVVLALAALRVADPWPLPVLREAYFDRLQQILPREKADFPVRIADVDERSLAALGQWPWPRDRMAALILRLADLGAAVVALDILFSEPDRMSPGRLAQLPEVRNAVRNTEALVALSTLDNDRTLAEAMAALPVVLGIAHAPEVAASPPLPGIGYAEIGGPAFDDLLTIDPIAPIVPALRETAAGFGGINVSGLSEEGRVRSVPLAWRSGEGIVASLGLEALRVALGGETLRFHAGPAGLEAIGLAEFEAPVTSDGFLRLRLRPDDPALYLSVADLLDPAKEAEVRPLVEGHIVFVGTSAAGLFDIRTTPLGEAVPGVSLHAQVVEQMLAGAYLTRTDTTSALEVLALVGVCLLVALRMARSGPVASVILGATGGALVAAMSLGLYVNKGVLFDATYPLGGGFAAFAVLSILQYAVVDREKRLIRQSFSRYVAPDVLAEIERSGRSVALGGEVCDVSVMFSDLRNYTGLSETMSPTRMVSLLNDLFSELSDQVLAERGTIDKFIGDEIMAFWNAPVRVADYPLRACKGVLRMHAALARINAGRAARGERLLGLATGIATGPACVGNIGSRSRFNYTAIGDAVNRASRIEDACRTVRAEMLVCGRTAAAARGLALLPAGLLTLKGVAEPLEAWVLAGDEAVAASDGFARVAEAHAAALAALTAPEPDPVRETAALAALRAAVDADAPQLAGYVEALPGRRGDYRLLAPAPAAAQAQAATAESAQAANAR